jgi:CheY-like chemotaxis protein
MRAIVEGAHDAVRAAAEAKNIVVRANCEAVPITAGDPDRLQQVVWNLAMNAVKFTPEGGTVDVVVRPVKRDIEVEVSDTGRGIDPDFLPHVFDRFRQAAGAPARREGGLGVGLAIVHHIVELHRGSVSAASDGPGKGATFTVLLPVRAPTTDTAEMETRESTSERPAVQSSSLAGLRIVVVDDDADTRALLSHALGTAGAEVATAATSGEAMGLFRASPPDVLLCDIGLPGVDGYSFMEEIRALSPGDGGRVPAAALTAHARAEDASRALEAGFDKHIAKPIEPAEIVQIIADLAHARR